MHTIFPSHDETITISSVSMRPEDRRKAIVSLVQNEKTVQLDVLAERFDVSRMTIHRDLDYLESRGLLRKDRGSATAESSLLFESNYHYRAQLDMDQKHALAKAAAQLVQPGDVIMIDDSTTALQICDELVALEHITVISSSLAVYEKLRAHSHIKLVLAGGDYDDTLEACYGILCEQAIGRLRADWAFLSAPSIIGTALYHQDQEVVRMKRTMMEASDHPVLLLTAAKFSARAINHFADMSEFDHVFIAGNVSEENTSPLKKRGIPYQII